MRHLFVCTTHPTDLSPKDLWRNPVGSICAFSYLDNSLTDLKTDLVVANNNNNSFHPSHHTHPCTSAALDTMPEPRIPPTYCCSTLIPTTLPSFLTPALPLPSHPHTLSALYTSNKNDITHITVTASTCIHRPSSISGKNLIILQINII